MYFVAMAPSPAAAPWGTSFDTAKRQHLFRNPPKDSTAYPTLAAAVDPHIHSFNSIFEKHGLIEEGIKDIGTKIFLDGNPYAASEDAGPRNRLHVRVKGIFYEKPLLPQSNKNALKRTIYPAECRERHATYRGKLSARLEYKVNNGDWQESVRDLGHLPVMLRVSPRSAVSSAVRMLIVLVIVGPVSPRGLVPGPAGQGKGRDGRAGWLLHRKRRREDNPHAARAAPQLSHGHFPRSLYESWSRIHKVRYRDSVRAPGPDVAD